MKAKSVQPPLRVKITRYEHDPRGVLWYPAGPFISVRSKNHRYRVEQYIMDCVLVGDVPAMTRAIKRIAGGCDYNRLFDLGRKFRLTGRLAKTILLADDIISGRIKPASILREIQRLAASARSSHGECGITAPFV